jgi:hypothetical protein
VPSRVSRLGTASRDCQQWLTLVWFSTSDEWMYPVPTGVLDLNHRGDA